VPVCGWLTFTWREQCVSDGHACFPREVNAISQLLLRKKRASMNKQRLGQELNRPASLETPLTCQLWPTSCHLSTRKNRQSCNWCLFRNGFDCRLQQNRSTWLLKASIPPSLTYFADDVEFVWVGCQIMSTAYVDLRSTFTRKFPGRLFDRILINSRFANVIAPKCCIFSVGLQSTWSAGMRCLLRRVQFRLADAWSSGPEPNAFNACGPKHDT